MIDINEELPEDVVEYVDAMYGEPMVISPMVTGVVPMRLVEEHVRDDLDVEQTKLRNSLYAIADLTKAINHTGDPILSYENEDGQKICSVSSISETEMKLALAVLLDAYDREVRELGELLGIDDRIVYGDDGDLITEIQEKIGYDPMDKPYMKSVTMVADEIDADEDDVYDVLVEEFGEDAERLSLDYYDDELIPLFEYEEDEE